jgi:hypothetical protein
MRTSAEDREVDTRLAELQRAAERLWRLDVDPRFVVKRDVEGFEKDGVTRGCGLAVSRCRHCGVPPNELHRIQCPVVLEEAQAKRGGLR